MPSQLLIATSNPGKFREISDFLKDLSYQLLSLEDVRISADFEENGLTFKDNAIGKARYYAHKSGLMTLAEDSGIMVEALAGELGVKTRRWGKGEKASDEEWVQYFLEVMNRMPEKKRNASFICEAALLDDEGHILVFEGKTEGMITTALEAPIKKGLPLSSCFRANGSEKVYAALSTEEKNCLSHRGKAMEQVKTYLKSRS